MEDELRETDAAPLGAVLIFVTEGDVHEGGLQVGTGDESLYAAHLPLGDGEVFDEMALGGGHGLPFLVERLAELAEFRGVFDQHDSVTGTKAVSDGVETDGGLTIIGARSGGLLRVLSIGF